MRGFKDKLSDDDIVAVLQYVKSLWPDEIQVRHAYDNLYKRTH